MSHILVLGAGQSARFLIAKLLELSDKHDWSVTVGDMDVAAAEAVVDGHARGRAVYFDVNDSDLRNAEIQKADIVANLLPPAYQSLVAWDCVNHGRHMVGASYQDQAMRDLSTDAERKGVLLLGELGLDPGIDHMVAMRLIDRVREKGGRIVGFASYGGGLPAPDQPQNPLQYIITWNPRNVVMSGEDGTQYLENGKIKIVPHHHIFHHTWAVDVDGIGVLEAYPHSDALRYRDAFGLPDVHTMIRGTLRYPGWSETWSQVVRLGLPNEIMHIPDLDKRTYSEVVEMFLPPSISGKSLERRVARFLGISPTGRIMSNLRWLGLFEDEATGCRGETAAAMMKELLIRKLELTDQTRDMVVLVHQLDVEYDDGPPKRITAQMVEMGEAGGFTAMSKTVGMPLAAAIEMILSGELKMTGCQIPTHPSIYGPVLDYIQRDGIDFDLKEEPIE